MHAVALAGALLLLWVFAAPARQLEPAYDEVAHVGAALALAHDRADPNLEHPPLAKRLASIGLRAAGAPAPPADVVDQWQLGYWLLYRSGADRATLLDAARAPFLLLAMLGALATWWYARTTFGDEAALLALGLYASSPTLHAHSALVVTDLAVGTFATVSFVAAHHAVRRASVAAALVAGLCAGAAFMSKFTGLLAPALAAGVLLAGARTIPGAARARLWVALLGGGVAGLVLANGLLPDFGDVARGVARIGHNHVPGYRYYLMGTFFLDRRLDYFPITMLLKSTPLELLAVIALLPAMLAGRDRKARAVAIATALVLPLVYVAAMATVAPAYGHRYVVPAYPLIYVAASALLLALPSRALRAGAAALLVLAQGAFAWTARPDPLTYHNGIFGCQGIEARRCLDDSNVDWGQTIHTVWPAIESRLAPGDVPIVEYFGVGDLAAYFPRFERFGGRDWIEPRPALYVLSVHRIVRAEAVIPDIASRPLHRALAGAEPIGNSYVVVDLRRAPD